MASPLHTGPCAVMGGRWISDLGVWERLDGLRGWVAMVGVAAVTLAPLGGEWGAQHTMERQGVHGRQVGVMAPQPSPASV